MEKLTLDITSETLVETRRYHLRHPILLALQRATQTLWRSYDDGYMLEAVHPYRACQLPDEAVAACYDYEKTGWMEPTVLEVELHPTESCEGYSLQQRHKSAIRKPASAGNLVLTR